MNHGSVGEFGRTPKSNKSAGRDHWPDCFSVVLAADRNFDFPRVYQQKPLIEGVRVLKGGRARLSAHAPPAVSGGGKPNGGLSESNMHVDRRRIRRAPTAGAHRPRADPRRDD